MIPRYTSPVRPVAARKPASFGDKAHYWTVALPCDMRPLRKVYANVYKAGHLVAEVGGRMVPLALDADGLDALALEVLPRLDGRADFALPADATFPQGARLVVRWETSKVGTGAAWALGVRAMGHTVRVAGGQGFRPAPGMCAFHGRGSRRVGRDLAYMAFQALPGSGSGIAGDPDSLEDWTPEGVDMCDLSRWHDAIGLRSDDA